jgi:cytochrome oxidase Cu insertion factor (SCO1/SenC/PrrC family)
VGNVADMWPELASMLARTGLFAVVGAVVVGIVGTVLMARRSVRGEPESRIVEPRGRRFLRVALAVLWIGDGLLQAQPLMPAGFVSTDIDRVVRSDPGWLQAVVAPLTRAWIRHPLAADAAVVWLEIGIGLLLLVARRGPLSRVAAWFTLLVAIAIWVLGEGLGGLCAPGASWLSGAPGAALVYALAAAALLMPWSWWEDGRAQAIVRRTGAAWLLVGALLEAIPGENMWNATGLAGPFIDGAAMSQPSWLNAPMRSLARLAEEHPQPVKFAVIVIVAVVAVWLATDSGGRAITAALVLCAATWWLAQDFGVLGGTATDPNTALPLALVLASAMPSWRASTAPAGAARVVVAPAAVRSVVGVLTVALTLVVPGILAATLVQSADSSAIAADSNGGLRSVPRRIAPAFALTDQEGRPISSAQLRGKVVVLTFLDPVCDSECPLVANQLATADRRLGSLSRDVELVAIDSNPVFTHVADVAAFTESHGLGRLPNWHFLCGPAGVTQDVLARYGIAVDVPTVGMVEHSDGVFFIGPDGREAAYIDDGAGAQLTQTYAEQVEQQIRTLVQ